jgi:hypothetical protein
MTGTTALDARTTSALPVIDPWSLTRAQLSGRRCAIPNCRRLLGGPVRAVGRLPGGRPVVACQECAAGVAYGSTGLSPIAA